jgi:hypothetical protein
VKGITINANYRSDISTAPRSHDWLESKNANATALNRELRKDKGDVAVTAGAKKRKLTRAVDVLKDQPPKP